MNDRRALETFAFHNKVSFSAAKRKLRSSRKKKQEFVIVRGAPVAGTGKPKGE